MKVVKLSSHKKKMAHKAEKQRQSKAMANFKDAISLKDTVGYCFVAWTKDEKVSTGWSVGEGSPYAIHQLPELAKVGILRRMFKGE